MENGDASGSLDHRIAQRLRALRLERGWSLDDLAGTSSVSRATLSRLENAEVSPTTSVLARLASAFGLSMSRLIHMAEDDGPALVRREDQAVWRDAQAGFRRRSVSPPAGLLAGEALECELDRGIRIVYDAPPRAGLEHHLVLLEGLLEISLDGVPFALRPGDCLRYRLHGASTFTTPATAGARYLLFMV